MNATSRSLGVIACAMLAAATPAQAQAVRAAAPQVYSSMRYVEEAGDVLGTEIAVTRTPGGALCVSYQLAEGAPGPVRIIPATLHADTLVFTVPPDSGYEYHGSRPVRWVDVVPTRVFRGRLSARGLRVPGDGDVPPEWLPRRRAAYFPAAVRQLSNEALQLTSTRGCGSAAAKPVVRSLQRAPKARN